MCIVSHSTGEKWKPCSFNISDIRAETISASLQFTSIIFPAKKQITLTNLLKYLKGRDIVVSDLEIKRVEIEGVQEIVVMMTLSLCEKCSHKVTLNDIIKLDGIIFLEEIF